MSTEYLDRLSSFASGLRLEDLEDSTIRAAKHVVLDTIGAILAGSGLPENANFAGLAKTLGPGGASTLMGHAGKVQSPYAALVNATAGVGLEMDEGTRLGGGHPSIHVTPGAIAVAEDRRASGKALLEAIVAGYEVTSRIGSGTRAKAEVHSHGTWGTIGTATATARLLGYDAAEMKTTMNLSTSMSPANTWTPCLEGATVRNLYPGRSGFQGILAAHLTRCGFTAVEDAPSDLYSGLLGDGFDTEAVVEGLGQPGSYRIQHNYFKFHACCLYNHPVLDAVQAIVRQESFVSQQVNRIRVEAPSLALIMADPEPENMLAAKFSIPYAVAASIETGRTDVTAFYAEPIADPAIRSLAQRVEIAADPEMNFRRYDYPSARVSIELKDGRTLRHEVVAQRGDAQNPAPYEELLDKFRSLTHETLSEETAGAVIDVVSRLDVVDDVNELTILLTGK